MRHRSPRRAAALLAALGLAVTACGASAGEAADGGGVTVEAGTFAGARGASALSRSAESTAAAGTYRVEITSTVEGVPGAGEVRVRMVGAVDIPADRSQMTTTMDGMPGGSELPSADLEVVVDGEVVYVRSELLGPVSSGDRPWSKTDLAGLTGVSTSSLGDADPAAMLDLLEEVGAEVETVGEEDVRGVATTHVRATVRFADLLEHTPNAAVLEPLVEGLEVDLDDLPDVPFDVWVDADGLVRRLTTTMDMGALMGDLGGSSGELGRLRTVQTMEMFDFGEPVDIQVPPADQVGELELPGAGD